MINMKTNLTKHKSILLCVMFLMLFVGKSFSQGLNDYNTCVRNLHQNSTSEMEFDIFLEWTGTNTAFLTAFQGGMTWNYLGLANTGVITGAFVPGSADARLPAAQTAPNWSINSTSKEIRFLAATQLFLAGPVRVPGPPGLKLGTFRITNTVPFTPNATPNFTWRYATGVNATQTKESFYLNNATTGTGFVDAPPYPNHCAIANPKINQTCPTASVGGPYSSCGDLHLNGSITDATVGTWSNGGGDGTFDPNATTLNATYHPGPLDLLNGVTLKLTTDAPGFGCSPAQSSTGLITFTSTNCKSCLLHIFVSSICSNRIGISTFCYVSFQY